MRDPQTPDPRLPVDISSEDLAQWRLAQTELRFRLLVESVSDYAIFMIDPEGNVTSWNLGAERLKGFKASEIIGRPVSTFYPPEDIEAGKPELQLAIAREKGRVEDEGWRIRKDGTRFWGSVIITALHDATGKLVGYGKVTQDLTLRRKAEEDARRLAEEQAARAGAERERARAQELAFRTARLQGLTASFAETLTPDQVAQIVFDRVLPALGADGGSIALVTSDRSELHLVSSIGYRTEDGRPYDRVSIKAQLPDTDAVRAQTAIFLESTQAIDAAYPDFTKANRLTAVAALPLTFGAETLGVLNVSYRVPKVFSEEEKQFAVALSRQCAQALDRARTFVSERVARRRAEVAEQRLTFLAEASQILASSLDYDRTLKTVSDLAVPRLGDWCAIEVVGQDGSAKQLAVSHVDPAKVKWAWELRDRFPPDPNDPQGVPAVIRTGKSELYPEVTDEMLVRAARNDEHLQVLRQLVIKSVLIAPLKSSDRVLGAITLVSAESGVTFGPADLNLAEDLGNRAGAAIENARLYAEAQAEVSKREEFMSIASHELRTPLTSLQLHLSSVLRAIDQGSSGSLNREKLKERLERADNQATRLTVLVSQLLDVGRLAAGKLLLDREQVELTELTKGVVDRFEEVASGHDCPITVISNREVIASIDRSRIDQVLTNLISNAIKYGAGKPIDVTVDEVNGRVRITVRDRGIGIDPSDQARIFDRFERASSARNYGGIGLGLWIVKQTVDLHGGSVRVESSPGQGSTFIVELPPSEEQEHPYASNNGR